MTDDLNTETTPTTWCLRVRRNQNIARRRINIWKNHNKLQKIAGLETCDYYTFKRYVFNNELSQVAILIRAAEMVQVIRKKRYAQ